MKKILLAASECVPFIKTGGLADVVGELPRYINKDEYDVRVIIPNYKAVPAVHKNKMEYVGSFYMELAWRKQYVGVLKIVENGVTYYFIDNEYYFAGDRPYGEIYQDIEKFAFFDRAVLSCLPMIDFWPDILHLNDWQTGLIAVYLKDVFAQNEKYRGIKTIMTIHNLKFQGVWNKKTVADITGLSDYYFTSDKLEAYGDANYLKGGIVYSDYITTVSDTYANEIKTPFYGEGLDGILNARHESLQGIVNGIDTKVYNPATDKYLAYNFDKTNFRTIKKKNKKLLQEELGLKVDDKCFMLGIVSRLTDQKGLDLVECVIEEICDTDTQLVILGTGDPKYENLFRHYEWKYKDRVSSSICYSDERAHKIYASIDAYLMPSLFEPCGLSQIMSMRYGSIPIVRETGGLKDTVIPYNEYEQTGTGFGFCNYNAHEMLATIRYAKSVFYNNKRSWNKLVERAMDADFSWATQAKKYEELYSRI
ncbi:MAG: glycogen synthase GlgA [Lachnospiraceae bacterium]|nr:glycogen synthase GlgA [Lachnospiraceae bacterium]